MINTQILPPPENQWIGFTVEGVSQSGIEYQAHKFGYYVDGHFYAYAGTHCVRIPSNEKVVKWDYIKEK